MLDKTRSNEKKTPQRALDDWALVQRVQQGELRAFSLLVSRHQSFVEKVIAKLIENPSDISDLVQEVFIKAYRAVNQFKGESSFSSWLYRIAENTAKSALAIQRRKPFHTDLESISFEYLQINTWHEAENPEQCLLRDEIERKIFSVIHRLPEELKQAVIFRDLNGWSYQSIAQKMAIPIGTARSRIFRAREIVDASIQEFL